MNGKEVALLAIKRKQTPRLPVALIAGGEWYVASAGRIFSDIIKHPRAIADVFIDNFRRIGQDIIWTGAGLLNYPIHFLGCDIVDDDSTSPMLAGTVIRDLDELAKLDIDRVISHPTMRGIIKSHHLVADAIGRETLILNTLWGPFTTAARIIGPEKLMLETLTNPEKVKALIAFSRELIWELAKRIMDHDDLAGFNISEPMSSGDLISPDTFRKFVRPELEILRRQANEANKIMSLHICGNTSNILEDILSIRPDCYSLESKVDLRQAKAVLGGSVCVLGNVSPTDAFLTGSPEAVIKEARACITAWGDTNGYILSLGCDFPKEVPFENIKALMSLKEG